MIFASVSQKQHFIITTLLKRKEHVVVMERVLNRQLAKDECVHHIDGDRQNNKEENLVVIPANKHHREAHYSLQKIGYDLVKAGLVYFDKAAYEYKAYEKLRELLGHPLSVDNHNITSNGKCDGLKISTLDNQQGS